jgi:hypothetical protein
MWSLVVGLAICLAAVGGILINIYVLLALLLAKQVHCNKRLFFSSQRKILLPRIEKSAFNTGTFSPPPDLGSRIYRRAL